MGWSEDSLHRWLARRAAPRALVGSQHHDAAVLRRLAGRPVLCTDQVLEGVHFERGTPPAKIGRKAADRALSDLAATAAAPRALVLDVAAPHEADETDLRKLISAVDARGEQFGAELVAGDLAATTGPLTLSVTALGEFPARGKPPGRDRARPGDTVVLTGPVGGSLLGRHLRIEPRVAEGAWLHASGARAMMDVSDGLALDLSRIARASGVAITLDALPVHRDARRAARTSGRTAEDHALTDGEDHELIATLPRSALARVLAGAARHCPGLSVIGHVAEGAGLHLALDAHEGPWRDGGGWLHGS